MDHALDSMAYIFILVCEHDITNNSAFEKRVEVEAMTFVDNLCHCGTDGERALFKTHLHELLRQRRYRKGDGEFFPIFRQRFFDNLNFMDNICSEARDMIVEMAFDVGLVPPGTCPTCGTAS